MAWLLRHLTDNSDFCVLFEGKNIVVVLEQNHALTGDPARGSVVSRLIICSRVGKSLLCTQYNINCLINHLIKDILAEFAAFYRFNDFSVAVTVGSGHLKVLTGDKSGNTLIFCAPVGNHHSLKAEITAEHVCEQPFVFSAVNAVEPVIHAHHSPRLSLSDCDFKSCQIDFTQGSLINNSADCHSACLLIVDCIVL